MLFHVPHLALIGCLPAQLREHAGTVDGLMIKRHLVLTLKLLLPFVLLFRASEIKSVHGEQGSTAVPARHRCFEKDSPQREPKAQLRLKMVNVGVSSFYRTRTK